MSARDEPISRLIEAYQVHFDPIYVAGIPNLLCNSGAFLSFMAVLTGTDTLAGLYEPTRKSGERFKSFVEKFFPPELAAMSADLWKFRNAMVHSFHPGPFALTHHNSRSHLSTMYGPTLLNAKDLYAALVFAYRGYFGALVRDIELQEQFVNRNDHKDGGAPETYVFAKPL